MVRRHILLVVCFAGTLVIEESYLSEMRADSCPILGGLVDQYLRV
jgi:hypothetical protein